MNFESLEDIANHIVSDGKGILAADESTPTITKDLTRLIQNQPKKKEEIIENYYLELKA